MLGDTKFVGLVDEDKITAGVLTFLISNEDTFGGASIMIFDNVCRSLECVAI